jgi:hypothetical protein
MAGAFDDDWHPLDIIFSYHGVCLRVAGGLHSASLVPVRPVRPPTYLRSRLRPAVDQRRQLQLCPCYLTPSTWNRTAQLRRLNKINRGLAPPRRGPCVEPALGPARTSLLVTHVHTVVTLPTRTCFIPRSECLSTTLTSERRGGIRRTIASYSFRRPFSPTTTLCRRPYLSDITSKHHF